LACDTAFEKICASEFCFTAFGDPTRRNHLRRIGAIGTGSDLHREKFVRTQKGNGSNMSPKSTATRAAEEHDILSEYHLEERFSFLVNRVAVGVVEIFSRDALKFGISIPMWRVLAVLIDGGQMRLVDIAKLTSIDASSLSRITDAMHAKRIISRTRSRQNRRELVISATERGKEIARALVPTALSYEGYMTEGVSAADIETTKNTLRKMFARLQEII
jgi:DNA-binding MarR family transcriptional regulator